MMKRLLIYLVVGLTACALSVLLLHITSVIAAVGAVNASVATSWRLTSPPSWKG
jgi:uncharacterized membrane-anchored protein YitT (DUF2179 family)